MAKKSIDYAAARRAAEEKAKKQKRNVKIFLISAIAVLVVAVLVAFAYARAFSIVWFVMVLYLFSYILFWGILSPTL